MKALAVTRDLTITAMCVLVGYIAFEEARDIPTYRKRRRLAAVKEDAA